MTTAMSVCLSGISWCTRCDLDQNDGDEFHRTTIETELLTVEVEQVTNDQHGAEPVTFRLRVHDEPPLTATEARQAAADILAAVAAIPTR